jgi:hypothetical protein
LLLSVGLAVITPRIQSNDHRSPLTNTFCIFATCDEPDDDSFSEALRICYGNLKIEALSKALNYFLLTEIRKTAGHFGHFYSAELVTEDQQLQWIQQGKGFEDV